MNDVKIIPPCPRVNGGEPFPRRESGEVVPVSSQDGLAITPCPDCGAPMAPDGSHGEIKSVRKVELSIAQRKELQAVEDALVAQLMSMGPHAAAGGTFKTWQAENAALTHSLGERIVAIFPDDVEAAKVMALVLREQARQRARNKRDGRDEYDSGEEV